MADPSVPHAARADWDALAAVQGEGPARRGRLAALPEPARRWLAHAVPEGVADARAVELETRGEVRIGRWRPFRARQLIVPGAGFVWVARAGRRPASVTGFDRYVDGAGEMRWRLAGLVPVMSATGADIDRSAAGRLAAETTLVPPRMLHDDVAWEPLDAARARAAIVVGGRTHTLTIEVSGDGALAAVSLPRWGAPTREGPAREGVFRVRMHGEARHDGVALPGGFTAGWDDDPDGEFMRCAVSAARVR